MASLASRVNAAQAATTPDAPAGENEETKGEGEEAPPATKKKRKKNKKRKKKKDTGADTGEKMSLAASDFVPTGNAAAGSSLLPAQF